MLFQISYNDLLEAYNKVKDGTQKLSDKKFRNFKIATNNSLGNFFSNENETFKFRIINEILDELNGKKYKLKPYHCVVLPKKNSFRTILVPHPKDRIIFSAINKRMVDVFLPEIEKYYIFGAGKRTDYSNAKTIVAEVQKYSKQCQYVLKIDIKKFFPSISKRILLNKLKNRISTDIYKVVRDSFYNNIEYSFDPKLPEGIRKDAMLAAPKGIPQGCAYSPLLANYYALPLDEVIKKMGLVSFRYLDDMILFLNSEAEAHKVFKKLKVKGKKMKVEMHEIGFDRAKTYIQPSNETFEYLGIDILPNGEFRIPTAKIEQEVELIKKLIVSTETINKYGLGRVITVLTRHIKGWRTYYKSNFPSAYEYFLKYQKEYNQDLIRHYKTRTGLKKDLKKMNIDLFKTENIYRRFFLL